MSDTVLLLGDFAFQHFEIPASISLGGEQMFAKYQLVGGDRVVDALGPSEDPISWSGRFRGGEAEARAQALEDMRRAGKAISLTWSVFAFTVLIQRFQASYERRWEIPYSITLEVITVDHAPAGPGLGPTVDDMVASDAAKAGTLAERIAHGPLTSAVGSLQGAVSKVQDFAAATQETIRGVLAPIVAVQNQVNSLITSADSVIQSVGSVGGVIAGRSPVLLASGLLGQATAMSQASDLYELRATMGRMTKNLVTIGSSGAEVVSAGGDLMRLAAQAYGDATEWATIAKANGLVDPVLRGVNTVLIPPSPRGTGGVLSA